MRLFPIVFLFLICSYSVAQAPRFQWVASSAGSNNGWSSALSVSIDSSGNVYSCGHYGKTVDFNPGSGVYNLTSKGISSGYEGYILKLNSKKGFQWATAIGGVGTAYTFCHQIVTDNKGYVYVTGQFGAADAIIGSTTLKFDSTSSNTFILKLNSNGGVIWAKSVGGSSTGKSITVDNQGNVIVVGFFSSKADFDPGPSVFFMNPRPNTHAFYLKLDSSGNFKWAKRIPITLGAASNKQPIRTPSITCDDYGNLYSVGSYFKSGDFDPDTSKFILTSNGNTDIYIQKLDSNGKFKWAKSIGGKSGDQGHSIKISKNRNVYICGSFNDTVDFNPNIGTSNLTANTGGSSFIQKLDTGGNFIWAKPNGGQTCNSIAIDNDDNIYSTGVFRDSSDFDPSMGKLMLTAKGNEDVYIQKLDSTGGPIWASSIGGTSIEGSHDVHLVKGKQLLVCGEHRGPIDFDPGISVFSVTNAGYEDAFILKLGIDSCQISSATDSIVACNSYKWINGITYTSNNNSAIHKLTNSKGCDSTIFLNLTINKSIQFNKSDSICLGKTYYFPDGDSSKTPTVDTSLFSTNKGCDSLIITNLIINGVDSSKDKIIACNSYKWINGVTYTSNNNSAIHILSNSNGCDSTISLNLTINKIYSVHTYDTICKGITYRFPNGDTSTSPKIHTSYLTTNKGCDSTIVTELKVYSISSIDSVDKCNSYKWINGITYNSNNYTDQKTFANSRGCDSTVFLKLRIRNSSSIEFVDRSCNTYLSPSGKIWSASGIYLDTIPNYLGCDSSIKVRLIIDSLNGGVLHNNNSLIAVDKNANYQWLSCDSNNAFSVLNGETSQTFIPKTKGDYAVEVSNANCIDTSTCYTITGVGIELNQFGSSLKVYPNPTSGNLSILLGNDYHNVEMTIRNSLGQIVLTKTHEVTSTLNTEIIGESGVYFIELTTQEGKTATIRIIKE